MKKILSILTALILTLCVTAARSQEQEQGVSAGISQWLKSLQKKIGQIVPRKTIPVSTGVAGVRGAKEGEQVKLYWKGKQGEEAVTEEEMAAFKAAIETTEQGDQAGAVQGLEDFMTKFPDSPLIPDAKKTLDMVKALPPQEEIKQEETNKETSEEKQQVQQE